MPESESAIVVDAPLRGDWVAIQTPAERVPSHGTDYLGQRYAFDFVRFDSRRDMPYHRGLWRHLLAAQPAESFLCWDQPVHSVFDGVVASVRDRWPDRRRVNLIVALLSGIFAGTDLDGDDIRPLAGNYVIVEGREAVAFYAHLRDGSVTVAAGQRLRAGDVLGRVGNSGNSTMPHLHFHLMDTADIRRAAGVPCRFRSFEKLVGRAWVPVTEGIPGALQRVRWEPTRR